jgi:hypothetical protein
MILLSIVLNEPNDDYDKILSFILKKTVFSKEYYIIDGKEIKFDIFLFLAGKFSLNIR